METNPCPITCPWGSCPDDCCYPFKDEYGEYACFYDDNGSPEI